MEEPGSHLEQLDRPAVLLLSAQLGRLDQDRPRVTRVLGLEAGGELPALVSLLGSRTLASGPVLKEKSVEVGYRGGGGSASPGW